MAFVRKKVSEDRELYNSFNLVYQGKRKEADELSKWYVDEDRNIYFEFLGGGTLEQPSTYILIWNNKKVMINVEVRPSTDKVCWIIENIKAAKELEQYENDIISLIKEATIATYKERKVEFSAIPNVTFVEEEQLNG
jgi:hypothetical protein